MSIIKKTNIGADAHYKDILAKIGNAESEKPGYDMLGTPLKPYDWVVAFTSQDGFIRHRIGYVVRHTAKQTTIMSNMNTWRALEIKKTSISPKNIIKVSFEDVKRLAEQNS